MQNIAQETVHIAFRNILNAAAVFEEELRHDLFVGRSMANSAKARNSLMETINTSEKAMQSIAKHYTPPSSGDKYDEEV